MNSLRHRNRRHLNTGIIAAALLAGLVTAERVSAQIGDPCATDAVILNTGYDHLTAGVLPIGSLDPRWTVISDPQASTSEPRAASTIGPFLPFWVPADPLSQWISGYPTAVQTENGAYIFQTDFCVGEGADLAQTVLNFGMRGDDTCFAYLNTPLATVLADAAQPFLPGSAFHTGDGFSNPTLNFVNYPLSTINGQIGKNLLTIRVQNIGSAAMGLNVVATVLASPAGTLVKPECCNNFGAVQGRKFNDLDGDGTRDSGEPGLPGWTINITSGTFSASVVTDGNGFYNFVNLPPGTYTITETQQSGWAQTFPASGSHIVTLTGIQGINGLDFGNKVAPCLNVSHEKVLCQLSSTDPPVLTGCFTYTFDITNKTDQPVKYVTLPAAAISPAGVTISPNVINLLLQDGSLLDPGESTTITLTICGGHSGDEVCFHISLQTPLFEECCFAVLCVELPPCDCGQLSRQEFSNVVCNPDGTVNFTFEFNLENLSTFLVTDVFLIPFNDEDAVIVPDYVAVVLPPGGSVHLTVQIMGAHPGEEFCFFVVSKHFGKEGKECCCAIQKCITVPECPKEQPLGCCDIPGALCSMTTQADCQGMWNPNAICGPAGICIDTHVLGCCTHPDGTCSTTTQADCDGTWNPGATCLVPGGCVLTMPITGDLNGDGVVDSLDLGILLASWTLSPKDSPCGGDRPCPVDLNSDGVVNSIDLGILLASWTM